MALFKDNTILCRAIHKLAKMSFSQTDCKIEASDEVTRQVALAMGVPGVICLALSIVGLIAELVFVCKKKNNFLLRLFIYMTVAVTITHVAYTSYLLIYFDPENGPLCAWIEALTDYPTMVEILFIISINCVLLHKVYTSVRRSYYHCHRSKAIEVIFVVVHFIIPLIIVGVLKGIVGSPNPSECHIRGKDCNSTDDPELLYTIATEYIPVAIEIPLSILCICTLSVWLCWLLRKHFLRARMRTILKEIGLLLGFLSSYCIIRIVIEILNIITFFERDQISVKLLIGYALYPINRVTIPVSFIIYLCFVYLCPPRSDQNTNPPTDQHTHPPSTRVSLPSNTADHAPNFLSESTIMDSTYIESKRDPTEATPLLMVN